jgi:hypothetical protein
MHAGGSLPAACRTFLGTLGGSTSLPHEAECPRCAAHAGFARRMAAALRVPPAAPPAIRAPQFAHAVLERLVEHAAEAPVFRKLAEPVLSPPADAPCPEPLLVSPVARRAMATPAAPTAATWHRVHDAILADLLAPRRLRIRRRWLGAAVAAVLVGVALSHFGRAVVDNQIDIVFVELEHAPGLEFTAIRHGVLR